MNAITIEDTSAAAPPRQRFTVDGNDELENYLEKICARIASGLRGLIPARKLQAVLLGGGYGRGEGGAWRSSEGDRPYNDFEFYVCLRGNRHWNERRYRKPIEILGEILTPQAGVHVEFKIISLAELARRPVSMFSYDLVMGHRCLAGDERLLAACARHRQAQDIPLAEATRLLMNRCSGLLFARERLLRANFTPADADFVRRNIAKAELALGDAVLAVYRRYHWSCLERQARLRRLESMEPLPWLEEIRSRHASAVEFKLRPKRGIASAAALLKPHAIVSDLSLQVWLWLEGLRLDAVFNSAHDYATSKINKCPETFGARNFLLRWKAPGSWPALRRLSFRHPREKILHALTLLLWEPATLVQPALLKRVQAELNTSAACFPDLVAAYQAIWRSVS
ncbi:MAG: hypothetical protein KGJ37_01790 [Verrucomicrobiota bacterium]|nr:hypothetical protein [Verrucomicrobiota bacterium]